MIERTVSSMASHVLVADDERSIRLMLEAGLKLNGFRVTSVVLRKNCIRPAPRRF